MIAPTAVTNFVGHFIATPPRSMLEPECLSLISDYAQFVASGSAVIGEQPNAAEK
jgi:hypothetical protein